MSVIEEVERSFGRVHRRRHFQETNAKLILEV